MTGTDYWDEEVIYCGRSIPVAQLLIDGWAGGDDDVIAALDRYAYESGDRFISETLLHLRRVYKKPMFRGMPSSSSNLPSASYTDEAVLKSFLSKPKGVQKDILRKSIRVLQGEYDIQGNALFTNKQDWIAVYLLVTSRLKVRTTQKTFPEYAAQVTPEDFPEALRIGSSTITNISHLGLPDTPYYMWSEKQLARYPQTARIYNICTRLWILIAQNIYDIS